MSTKNLHSLFSGLYYINSEYAISLIPSLYKSFVLGEVTAEETELQKIESCKSSFNIEGSSDKKTVAVISIKQPIQKFSSWNFIGSKSFMSILNSYLKDDTVVGVVLDIDSGGGQVYGTGEFYDFISNYSKPIVAYTDGYMCSAAYYLGNATQYIIANKRADHIGSIGAYASMVDFSGVFEKLGAKIYNVYASKSTKKNSEYRELMENGNEKPYIENILDPIVETFHIDMLSSRPGINKECLDGGTWSGPKSLEMGLIDEIGTIETAINKVFELSEKNKPNTHTMSKISYPKIEAALEMEASFESNEEGTFLSEEQLATIENNIIQLEAAANFELDLKVTSETNLATAISEKEAAEALVTASALANENLINQVNESLGLEGEAKVTTVIDAVAALNAHIAMLGGQAGATHTSLGDGGTPPNPHATMDFNTEFYNTTKNLLKN